MSGRNSNDPAQVRVFSAAILDKWLDGDTREAVVVYPWGEARFRPSDLGYERLLRVEKWAVKHDRERPA